MTTQQNTAALIAHWDNANAGLDVDETVTAGEALRNALAASEAARVAAEAKTDAVLALHATDGLGGCIAGCSDAPCPTRTILSSAPVAVAATDDRESFMRIHTEVWDEWAALDENGQQLARSRPELLYKRLSAAGFHRAVPSEATTDETPTCVHCGMGLGDSIGGGLFTHVNHLQRCQSGAPYGHMGHPSMPCPSGTVNDCLGSIENPCLHVAVQGITDETDASE